MDRLFSASVLCRLVRINLPTVLLVACVAVVLLGSPRQAHAQLSKPNIVIIFIDDMGYGDVGFNGATVPKTPNLDEMAKEGMKFTDFYVGCPVCSGSRTALMTGCHYQRLNVAPVLFPNSKQGLHPDEVTLADMLKGAGYATACIGKWHLGHLPPCLPTYQGFDQYFGIPYSNDMWLDPANKLSKDIVLREGITLEGLKAGKTGGRNKVPLMRDEEVIEYPADQSTLTKRYTEEAIGFMTENAKKNKPFFVYMPHTMVHYPLAVSEAFNNPNKAMITNAIEEVDWSVGQILKAIKDLDIDDDTLVIFTSDNGAALGTSAPLRAKKFSVYDGGIREPTVMRWPGVIPAGTVCHELAATIDMMPTLAYLAQGTLPTNKIDGKNILPLMKGEKGAVSPHETYVLWHKPGTVRSGKWKFYPWQEGQGGRQNAPSKIPSDYPVQLYDTEADISETTNVAEKYPEVVKRLQKAYDDHVAELKANNRPTAQLQRPKSAEEPTKPNNKKAKPATK
ncbi:sulfatase-like hydrolase/transferase [bacterium]|nr:sulfatase-like hydrolase/transferase [bacterium]